MQNKTAPLKSSSEEVMKDREKQMERCVEQYSGLNARENVVTVVFPRTFSIEHWQLERGRPREPSCASRTSASVT